MWRTAKALGRHPKTKHTISFTEFVAATLDFKKAGSPFWVNKAFDALNSQGMGFVDTADHMIE